MTTAVLGLACAATGLALAWALILYLLPAIEDTTVDFDTPHLGVRLRIVK